MANIFQEIFLSPKECQLIDMINSSKNIKTYGKQDKNFRETSTTYCIRRSDMNVVATHRWHCAQGDLYTLDISHTGIPQNIASQYDQENYNIPEKVARRIFMRMQRKYIKQTQR